MARLLGLVGLAGLSACSWTFDGGVTDVTLGGAPPRLDGYKQIVIPYGAQRHAVRGIDGTPWLLVWTSFSDVVGATLTDLRAIRLGDPGHEESLPVVDYVTDGAVYWLTLPDDPSQPSTLNVHQLGEATPRAVPLGLGGAKFVVAPQDRAVVYQAEGTPERSELIPLDGSIRRSVAPLSLSSRFGLAPAFDPSGRIYFAYLNSGEIVAYAPDAEDARTIGHWFVGDLSRRAEVTSSGLASLIVCGPDGLRLASYDGTQPPPLDGDPCGTVIARDAGHLLYTSRDGARRVALDGQNAPELLQALVGNRRWLAASTDRVVYTEQHGEVTDGFIGERRIMERGRDLRFSRDGQRVRFLEHAATTGHEGVLTSVRADGSAPLVLAPNTVKWSELSDGRVIAATNQAFVGVQNRIVVIDEARRTATWVADAAKDYLLLPGEHGFSIERVIERADGATTWTPVPIP